MEESGTKDVYAPKVQAVMSSEKGSLDIPPSPTFDRAAERKLLLKIDLHLLPILLLLFLVSFVDRTNIGNAKIEGMEKSLGMKGNQYNIAIFVFNIPYVLLDIPSNLMLRKVQPAYWLGSMMFCWGVVTIGQGLSKNFAGLVACRTLMGVFEAGFVPGEQL
jgi:MFS family permease